MWGSFRAEGEELSDLQGGRVKEKSTNCCSSGYKQGEKEMSSWVQLETTSFMEFPHFVENDVEVVTTPVDGTQEDLALAVDVKDRRVDKDKENNDKCFVTTLKKKSRPTSFQCPLCPTTFSRKDSVAVHCRKIHHQVDTPKAPAAKVTSHRCSQCSSTFSRKEDVARHVRDIHENRDLSGEPTRPFNCPTCPKSYVTKDHLQRHRKMTHVTSLLPCPSCAEYFSGEKTLLHHRKVKHNYVCPLAEKKCVICSRVFSLVKNLRRHEVTVHWMIREKSKILCSRCEMTFENPLTFQPHKCAV